MAVPAQNNRYLMSDPPAHLKRPLVSAVPILARPGTPSVNFDVLKERLQAYVHFADMVAIQSPEHWADSLQNLPDTVDAIFPLSNPAYPTEIWNSHPQFLVERGIPAVFWSLIEHDEPDFWRFAARDMLRTLGAEVHIVKNQVEGEVLMRSLAMKRFLRQSKIVVFGEQNFPWNASAVGDRVTQHMGLQVIIRPLEDFRARYPRFSDEAVDRVWEARRSGRYSENGVRLADRRQAVRTYLAIREILQEEQAIGFGVNCFGDLIIRGGRDVPCLAQLFLREEGYIAACDGDFIAMAGMALTSYFLDKPCMTSNLYPVSYVGALKDHFGDPLSPDARFSRDSWKNLARMAHCGFAGVVSPEMTPSGTTVLRDWGGTYEIKRDGRGLGVDGDLIADEPITVCSLGFSANRLMVTRGRVVETTRHPGMPHCESSLLLELSNLPEFFENVSRDHVIVAYGDHQRDFEILAGVLGLAFSGY